MSHECSCKKPDRYVSFKEIDCDGNARRVMELIDNHLRIDGRMTPFWDYFQKKRAGGSGPKPDDLFLIHCHINQVRELFETWRDDAALRQLDILEEECC